MTNAAAGKVEIAWIAGLGASSGLGGALARRFASAGYRVAVTGRSPERLHVIVRELADQGHEAHAVPGDVSSETDVLAGARRVAELGTLGVAVFNAAGAARGPSLELSAVDFEQAYRTTVLGGFLFGREAIRLMLPAARGSLLLTGATASLRGRAGFAGFAAPKAALRSLGQTFAREFGPLGIHVAHVVIDGGIDGERARRVAPERVIAAGENGVLGLEALAETYYQLHAQHPSAWTQELDLRPFKEQF